MTVMNIIPLLCFLSGGEHQFNMEMWKAYKDTWSKANEKEPVLFHCRSGFKAGKSYSKHLIPLATEKLMLSINQNSDVLDSSAF